MYTIQQAGLDAELRELLPTRVYIGISAGSMVTAKHIDLSDSPKLYSESIGKITVNKGLGFVDFQIRPHFKSEDFPNVTSENLREITKTLKGPVYAIDDNTAIKVDGETIELVSEGKWEKYN